jgi:hypothetical protein
MQRQRRLSSGETANGSAEPFAFAEIAQVRLDGACIWLSTERLRRFARRAAYQKVGSALAEASDRLALRYLVRRTKQLDRAGVVAPTPAGCPKCQCSR